VNCFRDLRSIQILMGKIDISEVEHIPVLNNLKIADIDIVGEVTKNNFNNLKKLSIKL
jgi:hypothetical protein